MAKRRSKKSATKRKPVRRLKQKAVATKAMANKTSKQREMVGAAVLILLYIVAGAIALAEVGVVIANPSPITIVWLGGLSLNLVALSVALIALCLIAFGLSYGFLRGMKWSVWASIMLNFFSLAFLVLVGSHSVVVDVAVIIIVAMAMFYISRPQVRKMMNE